MDAQPERSNDKTHARQRRQRIELWPIGRPVPYEANPRNCPPEAIAKVAKSIAEFGFMQPIVVDPNDVVVVGNTRLLAARQRGLAKVPVIVAAHLSPAQVAAYRIADNRTGEETSWNQELLSVEINKLISMDYEIDVLGFESDELAELLTVPLAGLVDPDSIPETPAEPLTKPGDIWILGDHRLGCGDCTDASMVAQVMGDEKATLMATDPPYLVDYDGGNHPPTSANGGKRPGALPDAGTKHWDSYTDQATAVEFYKNFLSVARSTALARSPAIYMCFGMMRAPLVFAAWEQAGYLLHQVNIWKKTRIVLSRSDFCWNYEPLAYGWIKGARPRAERRPPANATAVWEIASTIIDGPQEHPTVKPVELMRRPIEYHTRIGEVIYEPFCGSGTAIIAAELTGRRCRALELSPTYCDLAVRRWEAFSGRQATCDGPGHSG
jgi:DNA modification methylase